MWRRHYGLPTLEPRPRRTRGVVGGHGQGLFAHGGDAQVVVASGQGEVERWAHAVFTLAPETSTETIRPGRCDKCFRNQTRGRAR